MLNSCYETSVLRTQENYSTRVFDLARSENFYDMNWTEAPNDTNYIQHRSWLMYLETVLMKEYVRNPKMLYGKPFISNIWASSPFQINFASPSDSGSFVYIDAPNTGETLRLNYWQNIILGCKGFHTYMGASGFDDNTGGIGDIGLSALYKTNSLAVQNLLPSGD